MASTKCWKCKERPASRIGGFCHTCWVAAGKPDRERAEAMRAGTVPAEAVPLTTDLDDTLPAMRFVVSNPSSADTTHQQKAMRQWRETSPTTFFNRLADLEKAEIAAKTQSAAPEETVEPEPTNAALDEQLAPENAKLDHIMEHWDLWLKYVKIHAEFDAWLAERAMV